MLRCLFLAAMSVALLSACAEGAPSSSNQTESTPSSSVAGSSASSAPEWIAACDALDEATVEEVFAVSGVVETPGFNSERQRENVSDCQWTFELDGRPAVLTLYARRGSDRAPADAMPRAFDATLSEGEKVAGGDFVPVAEIELAGAARAALTDEVEAKYSRTRGLVILDEMPRLWKVTLTVSADDQGNIGGPIARDRLTSIWSQLVSR